MSQVRSNREIRRLKLSLKLATQSASLSKWSSSVMTNTLRFVKETIDCIWRKDIQHLIVYICRFTYEI